MGWVCGLGMGWLGMGWLGDGLKDFWVGLRIRLKDFWAGLMMDLKIFGRRRLKSFWKKPA